MKRASFIVWMGLALSCRAKEGKLAKADAEAPALSASAVNDLASERGPLLVAEACMSCHSEEMLRQQRLSPAQWEKVVKKMAGWGANLSADDVPAVTAYLAASYGPDGGAYIPATLTQTQAPDEIAAKDDGPYAHGNPERGGSLYAARCASCHGANARGQIGVNLVDRPLLYRAADFAATIRTGRAKMPAQPSTKVEEVADLLAHLRTLRSAR